MLLYNTLSVRNDSLMRDVRLLSLHLQELGCAKDLKGLLKLVSEYTDTVQRLAVDSHREHSKANTAFGQEMTETACNAFVRSVEVAVEAKDELHSKKVHEKHQWPCLPSE